MSTSKQATPRQKSELARRKAMGAALIPKPLRYIAEKTNTIKINEKGQRVRIESAISRQARIAASKGDGITVNRLARQVP